MSFIPSPFDGQRSISTTRPQAFVMEAAELRRKSVVLTTGSVLRFEAEMLRLESISGGGSVPRPKKNNISVPYRPKTQYKSV